MDIATLGYQAGMNSNHVWGHGLPPIKLPIMERPTALNKESVTGGRTARKENKTKCPSLILAGIVLNNTSH